MALITRSYSVTAVNQLKKTLFILSAIYVSIYLGIYNIAIRGHITMSWLPYAYGTSSYPHQ